MPIEFEENKKESSDIVFDSDALEQFKKELSKALVISIRDQVIGDVIPSLGPKNFLPEALEYMKQNEIPLSENGLPALKGVRDKAIPGINQIAQDIFKSFVANVDDLVVYDEDTNLIVISPFIMALEYGDLYRPLLQTITRSVENAYRNM